MWNLKLQENKIELKKREGLKFIAFYYRIYLGKKGYEKINYTFDDSNRYKCAGRGNFKKRGKS